MSRPPRYPLLVRLTAGCIIRSCLIVVLLAFLVPALLFLGGGAVGMVISFHNAPAAEAFRAKLPCPSTSAPVPPSCYVIGTGTIDAIDRYPASRGPTRRVDARLRLADADYLARLDLWVWDIGTVRLGAPVRARMDQGRVTRVLIDDKTFDTVDSPEYASATPRNIAIFFLALGLLFTGVIGFAGRKEWPSMIRESWEVLRFTSSRPATDRLASSTIDSSPNAPGFSISIAGPENRDKQALLNQYSTAPAFDPNDPVRQVIPLSRSEQVLRGVGGLAMIAAALFGVLYVQTILVAFMAACLALLGVVLVWWALSWKLILTSTGFEVIGMVSHKRRRWVDVAGFDVDISTAGRGWRYVVRFRDSPSFMLGTMETKGKWRWVLGTLGNSFSPRGMSAADQVELLEEWRQRYSA